jgi:hypothetical protein
MSLVIPRSVDRAKSLSLISLTFSSFHYSIVRGGITYYPLKTGDRQGCPSE